METPKFEKKSEQENNRESFNVEYEDFSEEFVGLRKEYSDNENAIEVIDSMEVSLMKNPFVSKEDILSVAKDIIKYSSGREIGDGISFDVGQSWAPSSRFHYLSGNDMVNKELALKILADSGRLPVLKRKHHYSHNTTYYDVLGHGLLGETYGEEAVRFWENGKSPESLEKANKDLEDKFYSIFGNEKMSHSIGEDHNVIPLMPPKHALVDVWEEEQTSSHSFTSEPVIFVNDKKDIPDFVVTRLVNKENIMNYYNEYTNLLVLAKAWSVSVDEARQKLEDIKFSEMIEDPTIKEFIEGNNLGKAMGTIGATHEVSGPETIHKEPLYKIKYSFNDQYLALRDEFNPKDYLIDYPYEKKQSIHEENMKIYQEAFNDVVNNGGVKKIELLITSLVEKDNILIEQTITRLDDIKGGLNVSADRLTKLPYDTICVKNKFRDKKETITFYNTKGEVIFK